jgi:branched-chain amino acid transport system substrate-binding protein
VRPNLPWLPKRAFALSGAAVLSISVLAACSSSSSSSTSSTSTGSSSSPSSSTPITIGASLSLTGDFSTDGINYEHGYELWANDVNAHGGLLGHKVVLKILNDASSPTQVDTNYQTLFASDHVNLAFGPFSSLLTTPASSVAARYGYAFVEGAGGAPTVFNSPANLADHNVFDVSLPIKDEMVPFVNYIASLPASQRPTTAAYPMADDPFADPPVQLAQQMLQALGVKTVYSKIFPEEVADYKAPADDVAASKPQIVVLGSTDVPTVAAVHAGLRAAALHAEAVHRGGRPRPGLGLHLRGGQGQRGRDDGAQRLVPGVSQRGEPGHGQRSTWPSTAATRRA